MAHALGDDQNAAATKGGVSPPKMTTKSLPGSLRDRYTNADRNTTTTDKDDDDNKSSIHRSNNVPSSRIVGFGTSPAVPVLARGGGKSFTERARSKLEQLKHKTQEALQARKERQQREQQQQQGTTTSGNVQNESTRELTRVMRRETVSEVVASATSAAELLFELRTCVLTDSREGGEPDASTHDMIAEMTHVCEERRARLAGLAGDEGLSEGNLVLVLETIEKVNGALDSGIDGPPSTTTTTTTTTTTFIAASGEDENGVPAPPANPIGVSAGNPFATPALSSPTTPSTRTVTRMDVPQTPEEEEAALAAAIAASLQIEDENKRKTTESQSLSLPAPPPQQQQQQQQVSDSNDIGNLIDF